MKPVYRYKIWDVVVCLHNYEPSERYEPFLTGTNEKGPIALELIAADTPRNESEDTLPGEPIAKVTVNFPELHGKLKADNQTFIKGWNEGEGAVEMLEEAGLVKVLEKFVLEGTYHPLPVALVEIQIDKI